MCQIVNRYVSSAIAECFASENASTTVNAIHCLTILPDPIIVVTSLLTTEGGHAHGITGSQSEFFQGD